MCIIGIIIDCTTLVLNMKVSVTAKIQLDGVERVLPEFVFVFLNLSYIQPSISEPLVVPSI